MKRMLLAALLALCCATTTANAGEGPIVWVSEEASALGVRALIVPPVSVSDQEEDPAFDIVSHFTEQLRLKLQEVGFEILEPEEADPGVLVLESSLLSYKKGSLGKRWVSPAKGESLCLARATLVDRSTSTLLAEIVAGDVVSGGGLFSTGGKKIIPARVAGDIAEALGAVFLDK